jgi:hypothetical protein
MLDTRRERGYNKPAPSGSSVRETNARMKREAGENPAQGRCCFRPGVRAFRHCGVSRGKAVRVSLRAVSQKTCLAERLTWCLGSRPPRRQDSADSLGLRTPMMLLWLRSGGTVFSPGAGRKDCPKTMSNEGKAAFPSAFAIALHHGNYYPAEHGGKREIERNRSCQGL